MLQRAYNKLVIRPWDRMLPTRKRLFNALFTPRHLNIGGGNFFEKGWINLDELRVPGVTYTKLSPQVKFPISDEQIEVAYNSHNLEHLDDATADRVMQECHRVLRPGGHFIIKVPDYDLLRDEYRKGNEAFFRDPKLGYDSVLWTWENYGVPDNMDTRYAMMVSGYWNKAYGDHFSGQINHDPRAYHGPARLPATELKELLASGQTREISKRLNQAALADNEFVCFNHQNAWSRSDLEATLSGHGFKIVPMGLEQIKTRFQFADLDRMSDWSMFVVAKKS